MGGDELASKETHQNDQRKMVAYWFPSIWPNESTDLQAGCVTVEPVRSPSIPRDRKAWNRSELETQQACRPEIVRQFVRSSGCRRDPEQREVTNIRALCS